MNQTRYSELTDVDRIRIAALCGAAIVTNVAYTILIPLVPQLTSRFGAGPLQIGAIFAGFALTKSIVQPLGGALVDRYPARAVAGLGLLAGAAAALGIGLATSVTQIIVLRLFWGIAEGVTVPALFRLCFTIRPDRPVLQSRIVGWFGASEVLGMAAGPALVGAFYTAFDFTSFFMLAAAITAAGAFVVASATGSPGADREADTESPAGLQHSGAFRSVVTFVAVFALLDFMNNLLYSALEPALPLFVVQSYPDADTTAFISVLFFTGLLAFSAISLLAGPLTERFSPLSLLAGAFALGSLGLAVQGLAAGPASLGVGFLMFMASQPVVYVTTRTALGHLPPSRQGRALGYFGMVSDVGWIVGPVVGAPLIGSLGSGLFFIFAVLSTVTALSCLALYQRGRIRGPSAAWPVSQLEAVHIKAKEV